MEINKKWLSPGGVNRAIQECCGCDRHPAGCLGVDECSVGVECRLFLVDSLAVEVAVM